MSTGDEVEKFLREARDQGFLTEEAAAECRKIAVVLMDVDSALPIDEIAVRKGFVTRKQADTVLRLTARRSVGPYEVLDKLGSGAVGRVFRARDSRDGTVVALKLLADSVKKSPGGERALERFLREARVAKTLNHPNIIHGLGAGESAGYTWFAMEFVPGETLESRLEREKIPEKEAFRIAREVVRAFEHLQEFHLIHRDVKPANLMVTPEGHVKLCDLGLTKPALREAKELGVEEAPIGTAVYVSPEQITRPDNIDWRADVYSLGATLYHMVAGTPPFTGETPQAVAKKHQETPPRDPREFTIGLSEGAVNVILKMLQKDPQARHASLADLGADMDSVIEGKVPVHTLSAAPVPPKPVAPRPTPRHELRKKKSGVGGLVVGGVLVAAAAGGAWWWFSGGGQGAVAPPPTRPAPTTDGGAGGAVPDVPEGPDATGPDGASPESPDTAPGGGAWTPADEREETARAALDPALTWWHEHPTEYAEAETRLRFVADRYKGTAAAKQAGEALAEVRTRLAAAALRDYEERAARAGPAETAGRLADAWKAFQDFPVAYADTPAAKERDAAQKRIAAAATKVVEDAVAAARKATSEGRFDDAKKAIAAAALAEIPATEAALRKARADVDNDVEAGALLRANEREAFEDAWSRAVIACGTGDAAPGLDVIAKAKPEFVMWRRDLDDLAAALQGIPRVVEAARKAWSSMGAETLRLTVPGRPGGSIQGKAAGLAGGKLVLDAGTAGKVQLDPSEIAADDVAKVAARALDARSAADQQAVLLYLLARRRVAAAKTQLDVLRAATGGADLADAAANCVLRVERHVQAELDDFFARADAARAQKRFADARAALAEADRIVPGDLRVQVAYAVVSLDAGEVDEACKALERIASRADAPPVAHLRYGQALVQKGETEKGAAELRAYLASASQKDPLREGAEAALADAADRIARAAAEKSRKDGNRLYSAKKWGDAEAAFRRVLDAIPGDPDATLRLGICHARQNEAFDAYRRLSDFIRENPGHAKLAEAQKELAGLEKFKAVRPEDRDGAHEAARALENGKFEDAVTQYERALAYSPFLDSAYLGLGRSLLARGKANGSRDDLAAAAEAFDNYLFLHEDAPDALGLRAETWFALGDFTRAVADADRLTKLDVASPAAPLLAAEACMRLGQLRHARDRYAESHQRKPSVEALWGMAVVDERLEEYDRAWDELDQLLTSYELTDALRKDVTDAVRRIRPRVSPR